MNLNDPKVKFDADAQMRFLSFFEEHGQFYMAARCAGVCGQTVQNHLKANPEFKEAFDEVKGIFRDKIEGEIRRRAIEGYDEYITCKDGLVMNKEGNPVMQRRFSDRLLDIFARRHIAEYREKVTVDHNVQGGVLLIPSGQTMEQWQAEQQKLLPLQAKAGAALIEGSFTVVQPQPATPSSKTER